MLRYPFILFDWGDTIMKDSPDSTTPMYQWETVEAVAGAEDVLRHLHADRTLALATRAELSAEGQVCRVHWRASRSTRLLSPCRSSPVALSR